MSAINIVIGETAIEVTSDDTAFLGMLDRQYADFVEPRAQAPIRLRIESIPDFETSDPDEDVRVAKQTQFWTIRRGDFEACYDPARRSGVVRQSPNRHSIDSVIRIIHTLTLAGENGFLLHSASAIRNGRAFLFPGRSGAGKTTMARLAPADAHLLSDEVSYVRQSGESFFAWGTPFTGELGTPGVNRSAPVAALCFLSQAQANRLVPIDEAEAVRRLMTNILFFAADPALVDRVFDSGCSLAASVKSFRLEFAPDARVWELIQ